MLDTSGDPCDTPVDATAGSGEPRCCMGELPIKSKRGGARPGAGRKPKPIAPAQFTYRDEPRWYCVRTEYGAEIAADIEMRRAGFLTLLPLLWRPGTPARRTETGRAVAARPEMITPLFTRYLFVQFNRLDPSWRAIATMRGVEQIFGSSPTNPTPLPDRAISSLRSQLAPNGCYYPDGARVEPLAVGATGRMTSGAMADLTGVCEWSDDKRVRLLMQVMGRPVTVTVPRSAVEPV